MGRGAILAIGLAVFAAVGWFATRGEVPSATERSGVVVVRDDRPQAMPAAPAAASRLTPNVMASATPLATVPDDPALAAALGDPVTPQQFYRRLRAEPRDAAWAGATEGAIRAALRDIPGLGTPARVSCATGLCEIAGSFPVEAPDGQRDAAMQALQGAALAEPLGRAGLQVATAAFGSDPRGAATYTLYVERVVRPSSR